MNTVARIKGVLKLQSVGHDILCEMIKLTPSELKFDRFLCE